MYSDIILKPFHHIFPFWRFNHNHLIYTGLFSLIFTVFVLRLFWTNFIRWLLILMNQGKVIKCSFPFVVGYSLSPRYIHYISVCGLFFVYFLSFVRSCFIFRKDKTKNKSARNYCFTSFECQIFQEFFRYFERSYTRTVTDTRRLILH